MKETSKQFKETGAAIYKVLADRKGEILAYADITHMAGLDNQTGYLTSARAIAKKNHTQIQKVLDAIKATATVVTTYPSGYEATAHKQLTLDGYRLIDGTDNPKEIDFDKIQPEPEAEAEPEGEAEAEPTAKAE